MLGMCRVQARTLDEGFRIRFENIALLDALRVQTDEAEAARRRAEQASLAKSQFLAAASHDLRQPLYALSLFSASLDELRLDADGRAVVSNIQDSIGAMEQLFNGLLDLSRLDAGVVRPELGPVSIDALFDRLSHYFLPIAMERGLELRLRSDGEWVTSDAALLEQVLCNLVANALRYTARGGVLVAARPRAEGVRLEVWDTGMGIAPADLTRIFEEFVQLGNAERDRRRGLGLGLSIARRSGALIGAAIDVASRPGRGSRFGFVQPAVTTMPVRIASDVAAPPPLARPNELGVLIVDDDPSVRLALADLLTRWNVRFEMASNADAALAMVDGGARYALIIADFRLPGTMNGLDMIAALLARHGAEPPGCALVTADLDPDIIGAAQSLGVQVLSKPLPPAQLRGLLGLTMPGDPRAHLVA
jgi:CheY-like chemotaxis protein/nitrogen-specific signal transduction histidine kinase